MADNMLVLVVEDEPRVSRYLRSSLQASGYEVLVAADGVKALELVQGNRPDLILLDLRLPRMHGLEVLENIRKQHEMPIIILTANDTEEDKVKALMLGADDYLTKPFGTRELQARIVAVMRRYKQTEVPVERTTLYQNGDLRIDYTARQVMVGSQSVHLTPTNIDCWSQWLKIPTGS